MPLASLGHLFVSITENDRRFLHSLAGWFSAEWFTASEVRKRIPLDNVDLSVLQRLWHTGFLERAETIMPYPDPGTPFRVKSQ